MAKKQAASDQNDAPEQVDDSELTADQRGEVPEGGEERKKAEEQNVIDSTGVRPGPSSDDLNPAFAGANHEPKQTADMPEGDDSDDDK